MSILYFEGSGGEAITPIIIGWALGIISGILIQILIKNKLRLGMARAFKNEYEIDGNALREEIDLLDAAKKTMPTMSSILYNIDYGSRMLDVYRADIALMRPTTNQKILAYNGIINVIQKEKDMLRELIRTKGASSTVNFVEFAETQIIVRKEAMDKLGELNKEIKKEIKRKIRLVL